MQPNTLPTTERPMFPITPRAADPGSARALAGFILALVGLVLQQLPSLLIYYYVASSMSLVGYSQMIEAFAVVASLLIGFGLFLLLRELGSRLSRAPAYLRYTPIVVLAGGLFLAAVGLTYLWLLPALYGGSSTPPIPMEVFIAFQVGNWISGIAIGASVLVSIFGAVWAGAARSPPATFPPSP